MIFDYLYEINISLIRINSLNYMVNPSLFGHVELAS